MCGAWVTVLVGEGVGVVGGAVSGGLGVSVHVAVGLCAGKGVSVAVWMEAGVSMVVAVGVGVSEAVWAGVTVSGMVKPPSATAAASTDTENPSIWEIRMAMCSRRVSRGRHRTRQEVAAGIRWGCCWRAVEPGTCCGLISPG